MGYIVAANPFGQMLFSPLVGWWSNKRGSVRLPLLVSLALFTIASAVYSILEVIPGDKKSYMLTARFFVGISSGRLFSLFFIILTLIHLRYFAHKFHLFLTANIAVARSYLSAATKLSERTHAVSMVSLAQVIFIIIFLH